MLLKYAFRIEKDGIEITLPIETQKTGWYAFNPPFVLSY